MKFDEKWIPPKHLKSSKVGPLGAQGLELYDLERFLVAPIFGAFWIGKSRPKTRKYLKIETQINFGELRPASTGFDWLRPALGGLPRRVHQGVTVGVPPNENYLNAGPPEGRRISGTMLGRQLGG